ncbi:guanine nucleotide exchange factor [Cunninghamella echinulata]|nr:guanine nucleotide exchange factor [Cunninghamella echinulata]
MKQVLGITILKKVAGLEKENTFKDISSTHEALKCLANCILLEEKTKIYVEKNNGVLLCGQILEKNKELSLDSEFLICRIIFFMTVNRSDIVQQLMDYNIADSTERILSNNVDIILKEKDNLDTSKPINPVSVVNEALKMLFNMILAYERRPQQQEQSQKNEQSPSFITTELTGPEYFNLCLLPIFKIIFQVPPPEPLPLSPPHSHAIHALMQYPYSVVVQIWRDHKDKVFQPNTSVEEGRAFVGIKMIELLQKSFDYLLPNEDPDDIPQENRQHYNIDAILSPIILVIRNLAHGDVNLRPLIAKILLPQEK